MKAMPHRKYFPCLLLAFAGLLLAGHAAHACSCGPRPTVLDSYEGSDSVVIARIVAVEKSAATEREHYPEGVVAAKMAVEKVYKGNVKVGDEMTFAQGNGSDCLWTFKQEYVGDQVLLYVHSAYRRDGLWQVSFCGRSNNVEAVTDDLLYLDNLDKVRGKTRISGRVYYGNVGLSPEGRKVRIIGADKTYEVKTDAHGVYEIYDVPAGKYLIEAEAPAGWKVDGFWLKYLFGYDESAAGEGTSRSVVIALGDKKHAGVDIRFAADNVIRGKVYDPGGKPMEGVCVTAVSAGDGGRSGRDCTDENGNFAITEVDRGSYVLAVNVTGKISSNEPFRTFYYPNVKERERAAVITIGVGEVRDGISIHAPDMQEVITVEGVLLYKDGKPVVGDYVKFKAEKSGEKIDGDAYVKTDAAGRFSLRILKGLKGQVFSEIYASDTLQPNCPELLAVLKKTGKTYGWITTQVVEILAERDLSGMELKYPFPSCKKLGL